MVQRTGVLLIRAGKFLLIHRIKNGDEYFVVPGGHVEPGETVEQAAVREAKEECGIDVELGPMILRFENDGAYTGKQDYSLFLGKSFQGEIGREIGGPEASRQSANNSYAFEWHDIDSIRELNVVPAKLKQLILEQGQRWI